MSLGSVLHVDGIHPLAPTFDLENTAPGKALGAQPLPVQSSVLASWLGSWGGGVLTGNQIDTLSKACDGLSNLLGTNADYVRSFISRWSEAASACVSSRAGLAVGWRAGDRCGQPCPVGRCQGGYGQE